MELFTSLEIVIMTSVVGTLLFVIVLLSIMEIVSRNKEKKNNLNDIDNNEIEENKENKENLEISNNNIEINNVKVEENEEDLGTLVIQKEIETSKKIENNVQLEEAKEENLAMPVKELDNQEILIEDLDDVEPNTLVESNTLNDEVEVLELEPTKAELELLKVKEKLEHPMSLEDTITCLEKEEEESAIISYQELLEATSELQIIEDLEDEPISITEVYERFTGEAMEHPSVEDLYQASLVNQDSDLNEIQLENTANLEKLDKEIRKTNKVLNMLNELKKNLD